MKSVPKPSWRGRCAKWIARPWVAWLLCLVAGFLVYAPALSGDLIWDDYYLVRENPLFRSSVFGLEVFRHHLFFDSFSTYYRPVQNWSYMLDYWLWRGEPSGYHLTNILLHSISGIFLFELLRRILPKLTGDSENREDRGSIYFVALLVSLIWIVHPVQNAAVAYISGRADSLASFFALLAWLVADRAFAAKSLLRRTGLGVAAALVMLMGLCSKEIALLWLAIFTVHFLAFERSYSWRVKGIALAGTLAVLGVYAVLHALPAARAPMESAPPLAMDGRVLLMLRALGAYAGLIVYPGRLYMERMLSDPSTYGSVAAWRANPQYEYLSIVGLLAGFVAFQLCRQRWPGRRLRWFGAIWFIVAFLPISNLFPLNAEVAEHWIYLASIGALLLIAGSALALPRRAQMVAATFAFLAVIALGVRTFIRAGDWANAETFCLRTIADGGATPRILSTLASLYGERGDLPRQEAILRKMVVRFPEFAPARIQLGICLSKQARPAEAESLLRVGEGANEVSRRYPRTWPAALNLARLRHEAQRDDEALAVLSDARARFPETWELVKYESELRRERESIAAALPAVAEYAAAHWWHLDAWVTLGRLRYSAGEPDAAIATLRAASRLDIYNGGPHADIARIELERGRPDAALAEQAEAMRREPGRLSHYLMLGSILEKLGRRAEAEEAVRKAQALAAQGSRSS